MVEDDFVGAARPDLASVGAQLVGDVTPFEHMKLRMLNGTHSSLAYLGYLVKLVKPSPKPSPIPNFPHSCAGSGRVRSSRC